MQVPLVSVLITSYNREKYIGTAIESVLAQSQDDFELIICDNASQDRSVEIAQRYAADPRVHIHINPKNIGQFPNRNLAAHLAKGKYLKYVDSDDAIYPHCLEVMTHMMDRYPNAGMLLCAWSDNDPYYPFELSPLEAYRRCFIRGERMSNSPLTTMYRRDAFEYLGGFEEERWPLAGDWDLILRIARYYRVVIAPTGFGFYREHTGQISAELIAKHPNFTSEGLSVSLNALRNADCPLPPDERKWAMGKVLKGLLIYCCALALKQKRVQTALWFFNNLTIKPKEGLSLFKIKKPAFSIPQFRSEPDWNDYPRVRADRLESSLLPLPITDGVSIIIAGEGNTFAWEKTIRAALVQSEQSVEIILISAPECSNPGPLITSKYPQLRVLECTESDLWSARNRASKEANCNYLKFVEPGTFLYPYLAEFDAHTLRTFDKIDFIIKAQLGSVPCLSVLDAHQSIACDLYTGWRVLSVPLSCTLIRKTTFTSLGGFNPSLGDWAAYEFFFRLAVACGTVHGMLGLCSSESNKCSKATGHIPHLLADHLDKILIKEFGRPPASAAWSSHLQKNALSYCQHAVQAHNWEWVRYPWARNPNGDNAEMQ